MAAAPKPRSAASMAAPKASSFASVWDGMTALAERLVAIERRIAELERDR